MRHPLSHMLHLCVATALLAASNGARADLGFSESPGLEAALATKASLRFFLESGYLHGRVTTNPPGETTLEQTFPLLLGAKAVLPLGKAMIRTGAHAQTAYWDYANLDSDDVAKSSLVSEARANADLGFPVSNGMELFGGAEARYLLPYAEKIERNTVSGKDSVQGALLLSPRAGLLKRDSNWVAGLTYQFTAQKGRKRTFTASDGSENSVERRAYVPGGVSGFAILDLKQAILDLEVALLFNGDINELSSTGSKAYRDNYRAMLGTWVPTSFANLRLRVEHRTLSYDEQSFAQFDTVPLTEAETRLEWGSRESNVFLGVVGVYASDLQSIPEYNADYALYGARMRAGFTVPL